MIYKSHGANTISIPKRSIANTTSSTKQTQTHTPSEPKSKKKKKHDTFGNTSTYPSHQQKTQILF